MKAKKRGNWNAVVCLFVCFSRSALTDSPITLRPAGVSRLFTCHRSLGMVAATSLYHLSILSSSCVECDTPMLGFTGLALQPAEEAEQWIYVQV